MTVKELNREQLIELKQTMLCDQLEQKENRTPSYGELADADNLISDDAVFATYDGTVFSCDDFFCSTGAEE